MAVDPLALAVVKIFEGRAARHARQQTPERVAHRVALDVVGS